MKVRVEIEAGIGFGYSTLLYAGVKIRYIKKKTHNFFMLQVILPHTHMNYKVSTKRSLIFHKSQALKQLACQDRIIIIIAIALHLFFLTNPYHQI